MKGEGVFLTFYETINFGNIDNLLFQGQMVLGAGEFNS